MLPAAMLLAACGAAPIENDRRADEDVAANSEAATVQDGLADAYAFFKQNFVNLGFDQNMVMGYGFHRGLATEKLPSASQESGGAAATR
jgi:hypothetical protein